MLTTAKTTIALTAAHLILALSVSNSFAEQDSLERFLLQIQSDRISDEILQSSNYDEIPSFSKSEWVRKFKDTQTRFAVALAIDKPKEISSHLMAGLVIVNISKGEISKLIDRPLTTEETKFFENLSRRSRGNSLMYPRLMGTNIPRNPAMAKAKESTQSFHDKVSGENLSLIEANTRIKKELEKYNPEELPSYQSDGLKKITDLEARLAAALGIDKPKNLSSLLMKVLVHLEFSRSRIEDLVGRTLTTDEAEFYRGVDVRSKDQNAEDEIKDGQKVAENSQGALARSAAAANKSNANFNELRTKIQGIESPVNENVHRANKEIDINATKAQGENIKLNGDDTKP